MRTHGFHTSMVRLYLNIRFGAGRSELGQQKMVLGDHGLRFAVPSLREDWVVSWVGRPRLYGWWLCCGSFVCSSYPWLAKPKNLAVDGRGGPRTKQQKKKWRTRAVKLQSDGAKLLGVSTTLFVTVKTLVHVLSSNRIVLKIMQGMLRQREKLSSLKQTTIKRK